MLKYKFNVGEALERAGLNMYKSKTTNVLSQNTLKKIKNEDTSISLDSLNKVCTILNMQPKDIIIYVEDDEEKENLLSKLSTKA